MDLIIFGGSFDPVHVGHIKIIESIKKYYDNSRILVIPCWKNPLKKRSCIADSAHRLKMLELVRLRYNNFEISDVDVRKRFVYSYQTVMDLNKGADHSRIYFAIGADSFNELKEWKNYRYLQNSLIFIVINRRHLILNPAMNIKYEVLRMAPINVSSTEIRAALKNGRSIKGLVTKEVENYIYNNGFYT